MSQFTIKQGDTRPFFEANLGDNISGALSVRFIMTKLDGTVVIDADTEVADAVEGVVRYRFSEEETEDPGIFRAQVEVTFGDGKRETYPNSEYADRSPMWIEITSKYG